MVILKIHDTKYFGMETETIELPGRLTGRIYHDVIQANINFAVRTTGYRRVDVTIWENGHLTGYVSRSVAYNDDGSIIFDRAHFMYRGRTLVIDKRR